MADDLILTISMDDAVAAFHITHYIDPEGIALFSAPRMQEYLEILDPQCSCQITVSGSEVIAEHFLKLLATNGCKRTIVSMDTSIGMLFTFDEPVPAGCLLQCVYSAVADPI